MVWSTRPRAGLRAFTGFAATCLIGALSVTLAAPAAQAAGNEGYGVKIDPPQEYLNRKTTKYDWLGTYTVNGKNVFCVSFNLKAPGTGEAYKAGDELLTKWGDKIPAEDAANISYLLLRYGDTKDNNEAAALAHLLHSTTANPRTKDDLDATKHGAAEIGYNAEWHLNLMTAETKADVDKLSKDAAANHGPWTTSITPPKGDQLIGEPAEWTISVKNAKDKGISGVPITLKATDGTLDTAAKATDKKADNTSNGSAAAGAAEDVTVKTGADGTVKVKVTPTGEQPKLASSLSAPAERPYVLNPVDTKVQKVVSTGGEQKLTAEGIVKAVTKPGKVQVTKTDAKTNKGIAGAVLRVTAEDKTKAATGQDGKPLNGADGQPAVVTTAGENGTVTVENLKTPQKICVIEVSAPPGYTNAFDPKNPPSACGEVKPGETLALTVANTPNDVPRTIPAGGEPTVMAQGVVETSVSTPGLLGLGALALMGSALVGAAARRSSRR